MAKGTSKVPTWLSNLWKGTLAIITLPINLVVRLVERLVVGKEGVQEHDKKIEEMEKKEAEARQEKAKAKFEEESIEEAIEDADLSFDYGDLAIAEVEVDVTEEFGADRMYSITCDNGEGYTIFRSEDGLLRTEHCPAEVEEQLAKLLELAEVRHREADDTDIDEDEYIDEDVDVGENNDNKDKSDDGFDTATSKREYESLSDEEKKTCINEWVFDKGGGLFDTLSDEAKSRLLEEWLEEDFSSGNKDKGDDGLEMGSDTGDKKHLSQDDINKQADDLLAELRAYQAKIAGSDLEGAKGDQGDETAKLESELFGSEASTDDVEQDKGDGNEPFAGAPEKKSFRFDNLSADVSVNITPLASGAHKAVCVCTTRAGEFRIEAERDSDGLIVINSTGDKIKPDLASAMKKAVMSTYSEIPCKMDAGFIDKVHDILSDAMNSGSTRLIGVAYGHTLFTPDISGKCARVSSDLTLGKGNKPKDVSLGARQSADEIKRDIVSAYTKVESTVVGGGLPDSHYTTQDAVYLVRHHNDKPDIISYDGNRNQGEIKSDRMLSAREIQSINDYLIRTRLVGAEIADKEAEEFFAERLDPCGDSSLVCCAGGLYAYTEQVGMSSVLHVGAIDGSLPDVYKEISEGDDVKALVGELIDETHQVGSELEDLDGLDDHGEYEEF